jgi:hypothetical protein
MNRAKEKSLYTKKRDTYLRDYKLGKPGSKTIAGTSVDEIYSKILEAYLEQEQKKAVLYGKRSSKAQVVEDAILVLLYQKGVLEQVLKAVGVPDEEVQRTKQRLKAEYDISPKSS